jgi:RNA polymerase sigma factor (sigma-70 family)
MPAGLPPDAARFLRGVGHDDPGATDADVLGRFIDRRDEGAFAQLVRRHGPMVYRTCRRLLPTDQDAEDAAQATFLVLAAKARAVAPREAVAGWLHGVARRAALLARRTIARRREHVGEVPDRPAAGPDPFAGLRAALDEELARLPDAYRVVTVLCDLEGRTRREAATLLGWPEGTVAGRLARARDLLARRLARHAPAASVAAVLAETAAARVPDAVLAALRPTPSAPTAAATLTREVLGVMLRDRLTNAAAVVVLALGCAGFGMGLRAQPEPTGSTKADPAPTGAKGDPAPAPAPADGVAWGEAVGGIRAGVVLVPADARAYRAGERVKLEVRLKNVGPAAVAVTRVLSHQPSPRVTDTKGERVSVTMPPPVPGGGTRDAESVLDRFGTTISTEIAPGQTVTLSHPEIALVADMPGVQPDPNQRAAVPTARVRPGKYRAAYGGVVWSHPTLTTGAVEFEVTDAARPGAANRGPIFLPAHTGWRELKGQEAEAYHVTNAWLAERLKEAETIRVGSTYADVCRHFHIDGGLAAPPTCRFVMILCPYIKIDVEFDTGRTPDRPAAARVTKVSRPYFQPQYLD